MRSDICYVDAVDHLHGLLAQLHQAGIDMCTTDIELALTMLDRARASSDPDTQQRNLENAAHAFETVLHHLSRLALTSEQRQDIEARLAELKAKLVHTRAATRAAEGL
jgi:hypothetical protein